MANPILLAALAGGALWLLFKPSKKEEKQANTTAPGLTVQLPAGSIPVEASDQIATSPAMTVTIPTGTTTPQQVVTSVLPQLVQQTVQAAQTTSPTSSIPVGVAKFPDIPAGATPQQIATAVIPQVATAAANTATKVVSAVQNATPLQVEELKLDQDPNGTILLARSMISAESQSGWKNALKPEITAWQVRRQLVADGKFGPKSAAKMAEEVGVLPLVRFFPTTSASKASALKAYRDMLYTMAANAEQKNPALAAALRSSANYDQGQGWATNPAAIPTSSRVAQTAALAAELKVA